MGSANRVERSSARRLRATQANSLLVPAAEARSCANDIFAAGADRVNFQHTDHRTPTPAASNEDVGGVSFLRLPDVIAATGLSKTSLYALIRENSFPRPIRLTTRAVAWVRSEVQQWAINRVAKSRPPFVSLERRSVQRAARSQAQEAKKFA